MVGVLDMSQNSSICKNVYMWCKNYLLLHILNGLRKKLE